MLRRRRDGCRSHGWRSDGCPSHRAARSSVRSPILMELRVSSRRIFRPLLALLLIGSAGVYSAAKAQTQPKAPDTMEARVQGCTACHGTHGQGTDNDYFPRLAGKPAD